MARSVARTAKFETKIRLCPFTTNVRCNQLNIKEEDICVEVVIPSDHKKTSVTRDITNNMPDKVAHEAQPLKSDSELKDEYNQLLVRAVAEKIKQKMPETAMWKEIEKETGHDHRKTWYNMRETTLKKIMYLIPANDFLEKIPTEMQLSVTEWLLFDLVLVHENVNVLNSKTLVTPKYSEEEPQCLEELFELVKQYDVEKLVGPALTEAWTRLTLHYNRRDRLCSPMMLQKRWYQMKQETRCGFYNSYIQNNTGDVQGKLQSTATVELTTLQIAIAVAYNNIVTSECPNWEDLVHVGRVILHEEFGDRQQFTRTNILKYENTTESIQPPKESSTESNLLVNLNENNLAMDFDNMKRTNIGDIINEDTIVFKLDNMGLDNMLDKGTGCELVEANIPDENDEEFKRLLIRAAAKIVSKTKTANQMSQFLRNEMGCDCKELWIKMQDTTAEKVTSLLAADDVASNMPSEMRLSSNDWLLIDLVLVHSKTICFNIDGLNAKCMRDLFELVNEYQVENLTGEELTEAWINLTLKYNSRDRQCSPMILQLRWYQLKGLARQHVNNFSATQNPEKLELLIDIAIKYQQKIIQLSKWDLLVQEKHVVLPEDFIMTLNQKRKWQVNGHEKWYLHQNKDYSNSNNDIIITNISGNVANTDPVIQRLAEVKRKTAKDSKQLRKPKASKSIQSEVIELDSDDEINEILREKADHFQNISQGKVENIMDISSIKIETNSEDKNKTSDKPNYLQQTVPTLDIKPLFLNNEEPFCDSDDEMDKILQEKANLMSSILPKNLKTLENVIEDEIEEFKKIRSSKVYGMTFEEVGVINKEMAKIHNSEGLDEVDFDDNNIEFVDDGIKFVEGCEYNRKEIESGTASSSDTDDERNTEDSVDDEIDLKLLMNTRVHTKKIDSLEVFKFIEYDSVKDKRVIEYVESESKPMDKRLPKAKDIEIFREQVITGYDKNSLQCDDDIVETPLQNAENRVKYTSWMLQKPKKRKYQARKLFKNPDFNILLKKITPRFLTSVRNRTLLKECKPLTIDLHKAFEKKLRNGTMYLKPSNFKTFKYTEKEKTDYHKATIEKTSELLEGKRNNLQKHIRNLIATMIDDKQNERMMKMIKRQMSKVTPQIPVKRSKTINLPDKDQIRLLNQSLLTAEIMPRHQPLFNVPSLTAKTKRESIKQPRILGGPNISSNKKFKIGSKTSKALSSQRFLHCCWARENMFKIEQNLDPNGSQHMCVKDHCTCCCRVLLNNLLYTKQQSSVKYKYISGVITDKIQNDHKNIFCNTKPTVTYSNLKNKKNNELLHNPNLSTPKVLNYSTETLSANNIGSSMTITAREIVVNESNDHQSMVVSLERDEGNMIVEPATCVKLPAGVTFVKLPDGKIALAINPGVKLNPDQLHTLLSVCATVNSSPTQVIEESQVLPMQYVNSTV